MVVPNKSVLPSSPSPKKKAKFDRRAPKIDQGGRTGETNVPAPMLLKFRTVEILIVSGDGPNIFGHSLLHVDGAVFHIDGVHARPMFFPMAMMSQWLKETGKTLLRQMRVNVPNPTAANEKLQELLLKEWTWWVIPHNCVAFIEDVLNAGGANYSCWHNLPSKCPRPKRDAFSPDERL